jgi:hypothetical protein
MLWASTASFHQRPLAIDDRSEFHVLYHRSKAAARLENQSSATPRQYLHAPANAHPRQAIVKLAGCVYGLPAWSGKSNGTLARRA